MIIKGIHIEDSFQFQIFVEIVILPIDIGIYGQCATNICLMLYEYMGKGNKIYAKCVKKYMGGVPLGSDTRPFLII